LAWHYLDLGDFATIAEKVVGQPAERLLAMPSVVSRADSALHAPKAKFAGHEMYPDFPVKAAILCSRLIKNHPLVDGNKRVAFLCMNEFVERNGFELAIDDEDEAFEIILGVAAGDVMEEDFATWVSGKIVQSSK
jgi:death-on-curing protein